MQNHRIRNAVLGLAAIGATALVVVLSFEPSVHAARVIAKADLKLADGTGVGTVSFENPTDGATTIVKADLRVPIDKVPTKTFHGFHIHANNDVSNGLGCIADATKASSTWFVSADGHFKHDAAEAHSSHAGDMPSIILNRDGTAHMEFTIDRVVAGELFDRVVILHAGPDNYGNVPLGTAANQYTANSADATTATANTGNAGDRIACGVIDVTQK